MKIKSRFVATIVTFSLALMMPLSFTSCSPEDKPEVENPNVPEGPETPDKPENPEPEPKPETYCYKLLTETRADWEGDWIIAYVDGNEITKELVIQYRELLEREGSAYSTINLILISINCYFFDIRI